MEIVDAIVAMFDEDNVDAIDSNSYNVATLYDAIDSNSYNVATLYDAIVAMFDEGGVDAIVPKVHNGKGTLNYQLLYKESIYFMFFYF
ncbi:hypothetical protein OWP15_02775 [Bacillus paranthracis]|uniref:hypothetical protein n=1 Tax=Bacillus paranthracis TaxID=2026186 RepID=UPI00254F4C2F|nr:hypothetical protein [Bacillus paranthracis]MDK7471669.1 hypothetical protein [Bacillus paranthracis]